MESNSIYQNVKVIGFDLDNTLFEPNEAINRAIRDYIYEKVAQANDFSTKQAKQEFDYAYDVEGLSGSQALHKFNVANPGDVMQEALERAEILDCLKLNTEVPDLLKRLAEKYTIDLITGSPMSIAMNKLVKIGVEKSIFNVIFTGDRYVKSSGHAFEEWLLRYPDLTADNFIYIGDRVSTDSVMPARYGIKSILVNQSKEDLGAKGPQEKTLFDIAKYL